MKIKEINQHNYFSILIIVLLLLADIFSYIISYNLVLNILNLNSIINHPILIPLGIIFLFRLSFSNLEGEYAPIPPVFLPLSPSKTLL